jgi:hypothetical protein
VALSFRTTFERVQGIVFDVVLVGVAAWVAEDYVQQWLFDHPSGLYYGLSALHLIAYPFMLSALVAGWGHAGDREELQRRSAGPMIWSAVLYFAGGFIVPGVLALQLDIQTWVMMTTIFAPLALFFAAVWISIVGERKGWWPPRRVDERPSALGVQALALLSWGYLIAVETMMIMAAAEGGPIGEVGVLLGILVNYIPLRILMFYIRESYSWERWTIAAGVVHLLLRLAAAQS